MNSPLTELNHLFVGARSDSHRPLVRLQAPAGGEFFICISKLKCKLFALDLLEAFRQEISKLGWIGAKREAEDALAFN